MDLTPLIPYSWPILRTQCWNRGIREKQPVSLMPGWQVTPRSWLIQSDRSLSLRALTDARDGGESYFAQAAFNILHNINYQHLICSG
jgi:hypothetical protein